MQFFNFKHIMWSAVFITACTLVGPANKPQDMGPSYIAGTVDSSFSHLYRAANPEPGIIIDPRADFLQLDSNSRRINIAICGVDNRMGARTSHADANHVISVIPDHNIVEVISVPRDTRANAGFQDTMSHYNIISNVRSRKGRKAWLRAMTEVCELDTIQHYVEIDFSQAMGLLEILGYEQPDATLRVLRSRKIFRGSDYQRTYNQGQFLAQNIARYAPRLKGSTGDGLIVAGLMIAESSLTSVSAKGLRDTLVGALMHNAGDIVVRMRPRINMRFTAFDFNDHEFMDSVHNVISTHSGDGKSVDSTILSLVDEAEDALDRNPWRTAQLLLRPFEQQIWLQMQDLRVRYTTRARIAMLLTHAYERIDRPHRVRMVDSLLNIYATRNTPGLWRQLGVQE